MELPVDAVVTLSTLTGQEQGSFSGVPASKPFPVPLKDNFDGEAGGSSFVVLCYSNRTSFAAVLT